MTESCVAACTCTGELTVAPFSGEQIFTDGDVDPGLQTPGLGVGVGVGVGDGDGLGDPPTFTEMVRLKIFPELSLAWTVRRCVPVEAEMEVFSDPPLVVNTAFPSR